MNIRSLLRVVSVGLSQMALIASAGTTIKVDPTGVWEGSVTTLEAAFELHTAEDDVILVRPGTYNLTAPLTAKYARLTLKSCDADGNPDTANTILDGGNANRVFVCDEKDAPTVIGFTMRHGQALGAGNDGLGGAMYLNKCGAFVVRDCVFEDSEAKSGGGFCAKDCSGTVSNCVVRGNVAVSGAGILSRQQEAAFAWKRNTFIDCVSSNNTANVQGDWAEAGAALYANWGVILKRCQLVDNKVNYISGLLAGGHLVINGSGDISDCLLRASVNKGGYGAAVYLGNTSGASFSNCTFDFSGSTAGGVGVICLVGDNKRFYGCTFKTSAALSGTSPVYVLNCGGHLFRNCRFTDMKNDNPVFNFNQNAAYAATTIESCTFAGNQSGYLTTGSDANMTVRFVNSILSGSINAGNHNIISNCCLAAAVAGATIVDPVYTTDPGFRRPAKGDYRLRLDSPCVDAGVALDWMENGVDIAGNPRVVGTKPDIGCYERQEGEADYSVRVVASEADKTGDWADAFTDVQAAVDSAEDGDTILARSGTYALSKTVSITNKTVTFRSCHPVTGLVDPEGTIFDGGNLVRALTIKSAELVDTGDGWGVKVTEHHPIVVEGFTFTNCYSADNGGAVSFMGMAPAGKAPARIVGCTFAGNRCGGSGGAVHLYQAGTLENCVFRNNEAGGGGGVAFLCKNNYSMNVQPGWSINPANDWYYPVFKGCTFASNKATSGSGGGLYCANNCFVTDCTFVGNRAASGNEGGGARFFWGPFVANCVVSDNGFLSGGGYGSGINAGYNAVVSNVVFSGNAAGFGALYADGETGIRACNLVLTNNVADAVWCGSGTFRQCLFADNAKAAMASFAAAPAVTMESCTIANNPEGAVCVRHGGLNHAFSLSNCIVVGNGGTFNIGTGAGVQSVVVADTLCDVDVPATGAISGTNVFAGNPKFKKASAGDYTLKATSAAREKAVLKTWMAGATDLAGQPRVVDRDGRAFSAEALPDCGCYEAQERSRGLVITVR